MSTVTELKTAKLNLKYAKEHIMSENDLTTLAEKLAEKMRTSPNTHVCPFDKETIEALKALASFYTDTQASFKRFLIGLVTIGGIILLMIGMGKYLREIISKI